MNPRSLFIGLCLALGLGIVGGVIFVLIVISDGMPSTEQLEKPKPELATTVISADGEILDQFFVKRRTYIPLDSIPEDFINALIATEDREFYNHWGVHVQRLFQAIVKNVTSGRREGASTITQQLARNLFLTQDFTLTRKIREALTAIEIERRYTKREILEMYINTVYFGRGAYGLQIASELYFNKPPLELTTAECAFLVGALKGPERYDPLKNYDRAFLRRNVVLQNMLTTGVIAQGDYERLKALPIPTPAPEEISRRLSIAPHFVEWIRQQLSKDPALKGYDLYRDGLIIQTTLNADMQRAANEAVNEHLQEFQKEFDKAWTWKGKQKLLNSLLQTAVRTNPAYIEAKGDAKERIEKKLLKNNKFIDSVKRAVTTIQIGFMATEVGTGEIRAMVGGSQFGRKARYNLNHVTQILRQPGSSFKPFVYASALEKGVTPETIISGGAFSYRLASGETWTLSGKDSSSMVSLRSALKYSLNTVAARLITQYTTPKDVIGMAKRMGITAKLDPVPSIALGSEEVSPYEMVAAFSVFPNHGIYMEPYAITRIEDQNGNVIFERKGNTDIRDAISPRVAKQMVSMMRGVVDGGTASRIRRWYKYAAAGKTGTTNDFADAWFVGYTPQLAAGTWVGFDDMRIKFTGWYGQGGAAAAPIWGRFMAKVYANKRLRYNPYASFEDTTAVDTVDVYNLPLEDQLPETPVQPDITPVQPQTPPILNENAENERKEVPLEKRTPLPPLRSMRQQATTPERRTTAPDQRQTQSLPRVR